MALLSRSCNTRTVYNNRTTAYIVHIDSRQLRVCVYVVGHVRVLCIFQVRQSTPSGPGSPLPGASPPNAPSRGVRKLVHQLDPYVMF